jgi:hypothetical protein
VKSRKIEGNEKYNFLKLLRGSSARKRKKILTDNSESP